MKTALLLFWVVLATPAIAQDWCHPGSEWRYPFFTSVPELEPLATIQVLYVGDTLFQGENCQVLQSRFFATDTSGASVVSGPWPYFTTSTPDLIRFWNATEVVFDTLVFFGGGAGTTWHFSDWYPKTITVLDTGTRSIAGVPLRYSVIDSDPSFIGVPPDTIFERIGALELFNPFPLMTYMIDGSNDALLCYQDEAFIYEASWSEGSCSIPLAAREISGSPLQDIRAYPNPGTEHIRFEGLPARGRTRFELRDVQGQVLTSGHLDGSRSAIDTARLPTGVYMIDLRNDQGHRASLRWIKTP